MSSRPLWISAGRWLQLPQPLRRRVLRVLSRSECVQQYACNVESALRDRGESALALELLDALRATRLRPRPGRPVEYPDRESVRVSIDADLHETLREEAERRGVTVRAVAEERLRRG